MKKYLLFLGLTVIITALPVNAELTTSDAASRDYLKNHGHSPALIDATLKSISQANGEATQKQPEPDLYKKPVVKGVRKFFMYIDPAYDDKSFMNDHEIHTSPSIDDL